MLKMGLPFAQMKHPSLLLVVPALFALASLDAAEVRVTVTNIPAAKGNLLIGLYDSERTFTRNPLPGSPKIRLSSTGPVTATISDVEPGTYAVVVIQDLNGNGKLDRNLVGMPTEPLAFSRIRTIPRGKPRFSACSFEIGESDLSITIPLVLE